MNGNGKEYALAMFGIALENDAMDAIYEDLKVVEEAIVKNPEYIEFLINPAIPKSERLKSIADVFEGRVVEDVFAFLSIIVEHEDTYCLKEAIVEFTDMYEDYKKYATALITSAVELTREQKDRLIQKLSKATGKRVVPTYEIKKDLIGGVMVEIDGQFFDGTVKKNLRSIKEVMS